MITIYDSTPLEAPGEPILSMTRALDTADISDRENVQYHWIQVEDVPEIWRR